MAKIEFNNVSKRFPDGTVTLKEASFTIEDGELFVLVGPSGCGKSTLLNMIAGLEDISAGEIRLDGQVVNDLDPKERNIAMVFQSYAIYPHMNVRENITFPLRLAKFPEDEITRRVDKAAKILELTALLDRKPANLSGGQRQRVAMGRAIVRQPKAFLMDEPLSNLDARLRVQMRMEIARLQQRLKTTMIYVTHDQCEAMTLGDRVAILNRGEIQQIGTPQELYRHPANLFVATFIGSPAMNLLPAQIINSRLTLPIGEIDLPAKKRERLPVDGTLVVVGIRPECFHQPERSVAPGMQTFTAEIDIMEWLGAELNVYLNIQCRKEWLAEAWPEELSSKIRKDGTIPLIARLSPSAAVRKGEIISLELDEKDIQLFDRETGNSYF